MGLISSGRICPHEDFLVCNCELYRSHHNTFQEQSKIRAFVKILFSYITGQLLVSARIPKGHSRSHSRSRSRSPHYRPTSRTRQTSRSYSPPPRRHGDYSASPKRQSDRTRSPRDYPEGRDDEDYNRRSQSPVHGGSNNGREGKELYDDDERRRSYSRSPRQVSRSPSGSRSRSANSGRNR